MKDKVREWIELAGVDLSAAERLIEDESLASVASFHAHQCIEKSFKALIENNEQLIPKIHDLIRLYYEIKNLIKFNCDEDILDDLSRLYIDSRYPAMTGLTPYGKPSVDDAKIYLKSAEFIFSEIVKMIENNQIHI